MKNSLSVIKLVSTDINKTGNWRTFRPKLLRDKCNACGTCARFCPEGIIKKYNDKIKPYYQCDLAYCKGCGLCAAECPVNAVIMELDIK